MRRVLEHLPRDNVEPYILANGCTDATPAIAEAYGVQTYTVGAEGKIPAIQRGLSELGRRAMEPVMILDADSWPFLPSRWAGLLVEALGHHQKVTSAAICGPTIYRGGSDPISMAFHTVREYRHYRRISQADTVGCKNFTGRNSIYRLAAPALDEILSLPNIWPGEDRVIARIVQSHGGAVEFTPAIGAAVWSDGSRRESLAKRFSRPLAEVLAISDQTYLDDAPPGSITDEEYYQERSA